MARSYAPSRSSRRGVFRQPDTRSLQARTRRAPFTFVPPPQFVEVGQASEADSAQPITATKTRTVWPKAATPVGITFTADSESSVPSNWPQTLPAGTVAGDLLILCYFKFAAIGSATVTGYTAIGPLTSQSTIQHAVFARLATGSDAATISISSSGSPASSIMFRIPAAYHSITNVSQILTSTAATSNGTTVNPPATATGTEGPYVWIETLAAGDGGSPDATTGWANLTSAGAGGGDMAVAYLADVASSMDPGTMTTLFSSDDWISYTFGIGGILLSETDTAQPITPVKTIAIGQASETDTAQPLGNPIKTVEVNEDFPYVAATLVPPDGAMSNVAGNSERTFAYPSQMLPGDLVIIWYNFAYTSEPTITDATGTLNNFVPTGSAPPVTGLVSTFATAATIGGNVTFAIAGAGAVGATLNVVMQVIRSHNGEHPLAFFASGTNPPPLGSGGDSGNRLWFAACMGDDLEPGAVEFQPIGWTRSAYIDATYDVYTAIKEDTQSSLDPGAWALLNLGNAFSWTAVVDAAPMAGETDTAQQLFNRHLLPTSETDTAQPITARKTKAVGQATETDTSQAMTLGMLKLLTPADESLLDLTDGETFTWDAFGTQAEFAFKRRALPSGTWEWWNGTTWQGTEIFISSASEQVTIPAGDW